MLSRLFKTLEKHSRTISFVLLLTSFILSSYYIPVIIDSSLEKYERRLALVNSEITRIQSSYIEFNNWEDKETALRIRSNIPLLLQNNTQNALMRLTPTERDELLTVKRKALEAFAPMDQELSTSLAEMNFLELEEEEKQTISNLKQRLQNALNEKEIITERILATRRKKSQFILAMTLIQVLGLFFTYIIER